MVMYKIIKRMKLSTTFRVKYFVSTVKSFVFNILDNFEAECRMNVMG